MVAVGAVDSLQSMLPKMNPVKVIKPIKENIEIYRNTYKRFKQVYNRNIGVKW